MSEAASRIFSSFERLKREVDQALATQIGNYAQLRIHEQSCINLWAEVEQYHQYLGGNYTIYTESLPSMIQALQNAASGTSDQPDAPGPSFGSLSDDTSARRGPGRPKKLIDPVQLQTLSTSSRITRATVGTVFECSGRTIRHRLVENGLSPAGPPVYNLTEQPNGSFVQTYHPGSSSDLSQLSDPELDNLISDIHTQFPSFGRRMIDGFCIILQITTAYGAQTSGPPPLPSPPSLRSGGPPGREVVSGHPKASFALILIGGSPLPNLNP
ncbi:hypothetical protein BT96DRAFT_981129 [Gymnopus androsaceus JB14]|uniref:Uncharacterized protein n=1 Tax=Gymnopus androsaceus JB14 TaxID=1447944 RepID=A0A6A4GR60_9AGAR|nr:hypothetical protein BT96DRAFT_981129 [Gymnopus androsaceus JB14]